MPRYAELIYNGYWWSPEREMLQTAIDHSQSAVNGEVRVRLYKGNVDIAGRRSRRLALRLQGGHLRGGRGRLRPGQRHRVHRAARPAAAQPGPQASRERGLAVDDSAPLWHGRFDGDPADALRALNDSLSFDRRMFREDIAGSRAHAAMLASVGLISEAERDAICAALDEVGGGNGRGPLRRRARRRGHPHRGGAARHRDHPGRGQAPHRPQPQRPGGRGPPAVDPRRAGRCRPGRAGAAADASEQGCRRRRGAAARLHPSTAGSAGPAGPSPAGPRLGAGPRRRPAGRGPPPRRCVASGGGGAGRVVVAAGPRPDCSRAGLRPRSSTTASTRCPTATSWPTPSMRWPPWACI